MDGLRTGVHRRMGETLLNEWFDGILYFVTTDEYDYLRTTSYR